MKKHSFIIGAYRLCSSFQLGMGLYATKHIVVAYINLIWVHLEVGVEEKDWWKEDKE